MVSQEMITKKCNQKNGVCKCTRYRWLWILLFLLLLLLIGLLLLRKDGSGEERGFLLGGEAIEKYVTSTNEKEDMIEIPGLRREYQVDEDNKELYLINPKGNSVYFKYIICTQEGEMLYQTDYIPPNKMERANLYNVLKTGEHKLLVKVETVDTQSKSDCNFVQMQTNVIVNN